MHAMASSFDDLVGRDSIYESLGLALVCVDARFTSVLWISKACARVNGLSHWAVNQSLSDYTQDVDLLSMAVLSAAQPGAKPTPILIRITTKAGKPPALLHAWCTSLDDETVLIRFEDALEQRQAAVRHLNDREQLMQISRTVAIGEMATTVAHELNQPIGAISNLLQGLEKRLESNKLDPETARTAVQRGIRHAQYAAAVIQRVREFVNRHEPQVSALDVHALIEDSLQLLDWEMTRADVRVKSSVPHALPEVRGDKVMLQQVLVNLIRNAIEAMHTAPDAQRFLDISVNVQGPDLVTCVSDNGVGLTDAQAETLFTAFFSSKPGGMGVGLHVCRTIVELHHGRLWFHRNSGQGTTFNIALPHWGTAHA